MTIVMAGFLSCGMAQTKSAVNFSHLESLMQTIRLNGGDVGIVHIYADYPTYRWTDAGDEGVACVDDVARAAVVFLRDSELRHDTSGLFRAKPLLKFILAMQTDDGEFYNFIRSDGSINRDGKTSLKSFGWWAGRAVWAVSLGYRLFKSTDPGFARALELAVRRSLPNVRRVLEPYGRKERLGQFQTPEWLLYGSGSDATTELTLGLIEFYRATGDKTIAGYIRKLADGMMTMQDGDVRTFPYGAHRSWRTLWHSWGNSQTYVLAYAGKVLNDKRMVASAELEARGFYTRLLIDGMLKEWDFAEPARKAAYEQIAYDIRPMALGLLRLYDATKNEVYLKMAGLATSWFFGNNVLGATMYDSTSGRCFDGITDSTRINRNSGAESTIEALYTLLEVGEYPMAMRYVGFRKTATQKSPTEISATFRGQLGRTGQARSRPDHRESVCAGRTKTMKGPWWFGRSNMVRQSSLPRLVLPEISAPPNKSRFRGSKQCRITRLPT